MANPSPGLRKHPGHTITITPHKGTVEIRDGDIVLARSERALELKEADYPPVFYVPFEDIDLGRMTRSSTISHCPFKGEASYWQVGLPGDQGTDVMWSYERPYDEVAQIAGHGAFYPDRVTIEAA